MAYNFIPTLTEDMVQQDNGEEQDSDYLDYKRRIKKNKNPLYLEIDKLRKLNRANYAVINELIYKVDSLENHINTEMERRFELAVRNNRRELEEMRNAMRYEKPEMLASKGEDKPVRLSESLKLQMEKNLDSLKRLSQMSLAPERRADETIVLGDLVGIPEGHYVIANVFETREYLEKFLADLKRRGIKAGYFKNPINGLNYVYLARFENSEEDLEAVKTDFRAKYGNELWIMSVQKASNSRMATLNWED